MTRCAGLLLLVVTWPAGAVEYTVDQFNVDAVDIAPGNGECSAGLMGPLLGGQCTLRAAIMETNATPGADNVLIPLRDPTGIPELEDLDLPTSVPIVLDLKGDDNSAAVGDLDITDDLTISVEPEFLILASSTLFDQLLPIIDASALDDRIFDVRSPAGDVQLNGLVLTGGTATGSSGGALDVAGGLSGEVTLLAVDVVGNWATSGAAVSARSPVRIFNSRIRGNVAANNGGIVVADRTSMSIELSSLYGNAAPASGGAVLANSNGPTAANVRILSSSIVANESSAVVVAGNALAQLQSVTVSENTRYAILTRFIPAAANPPQLLLSHTVLAGQGVRNCFITEETTAAFQTTDDFNLSDDSSCAEITAGVTNLSDIPAGLAGAVPDPLSWHWIDLPEPESALIEAGSEVAVDFESVGCVLVDQRGLARPFQGLEGADASVAPRCDIGALEYRPELLFASGFEL